MYYRVLFCPKKLFACSHDLDPLTECKSSESNFFFSSRCPVIFRLMTIVRILSSAYVFSFIFKLFSALVGWMLSFDCPSLDHLHSQIWLLIYV